MEGGGGVRVRERGGGGGDGGCEMVIRSVIAMIQALYSVFLFLWGIGIVQCS